MIPGASLARRVAIAIARGPVGAVTTSILERARDWPADRLVVLTYHRVAPATERIDLHPGLLGPDAAGFRAQAEHLARHASVVDLATVLAAVDGDRRLPPRSVMFTFDDAYEDVARHAWPTLRTLGLPAVMFVPTAAPGDRPSWWWDRLHAAIALGRRPSRLETPVGTLRLDTPAGRASAFGALRHHVKTLAPDAALEFVDAVVDDLDGPDGPSPVIGWEELRRMSAEGMTLAPHSRTHAILTTLDDDRLREELTVPFEDLRREVGAAPPVLAYPSGIHDERVRTAARAAGYRLAFTTARGAIPSLRRMDPLALPRVNVGSRTNLTLLRLQVAPATDALANARALVPPRRRPDRSVT